MNEEMQPIRSGTTGDVTTLDSVVSADQNGIKTHTFFFKTGEGASSAVLGLSRQAPSPEEAAEGLCKMLQGMMIEMSMRYPKVTPEK